MKLTSLIAAPVLSLLIGGCAMSADAPDAQEVEVTGSASSELIIGTTIKRALSADQRRAYLYYYAPLLMKRADEGNQDHWGFDWLTNFNFDGDGRFDTNKENWRRVDDFVENPGDPRYASWQIRPTMYSAAIEFMEGDKKSLVLLYHVYHALEGGPIDSDWNESIHDWERIEIRINDVTGTPGSDNEQVGYVVVTEHSKHNVRQYGHEDLNFHETATGRHPMIWQAQWSQNINGFRKQELHFVEDSWASVNSKVQCGTCDADVDLNGTYGEKNIHYVFVPKGDPAAVSYWNASQITPVNAMAGAARTSDGTSWRNVKRITYELQDLADIMATHADCTSCGGAACTTENGWGLFNAHWLAPRKAIQLDSPIRSESGVQLVPASSSCYNRPVSFVAGSADIHDEDDGAQGYPTKHWFWGSYRMGHEGGIDYVFGGGAYRNPETGQSGARPCAAGYGKYFCQHDYFAHTGRIGNHDTLDEYGRWLPPGWHQSFNGGNDGRWDQLFAD